MKIVVGTSRDVHTVGGGETPPCIGLAPDVLPKTQSCISEKSSQTGVSTKCALPRPRIKRHKSENIQYWYALRTTYGREKKAYDYMVSKGVTAFYPSMQVVKLVNGKRKTVTISRLPNIFFAHGTEDEIKSFVYDNVNLPFLRFYYRHIHIGCRIEKTPLVVPDSQMESLKIICASEEEDVIVSPIAIPKFETGQLVRIVEGPFKGVVGRVARYHGQQRVAVQVNELLTMCTTYVPSAFIETIE